MMNPIRRWQASLIASAVWLCIPPLYGQFLLVDRELQNPAQRSISPGLEGMQGAGFLADRFSVGVTGEVWVIDRLRTWGRVEKGSVRIGEWSKKVALFGGLEANPPTPGELECDCHNLIAIKEAVVRTGWDSADSPDVRISRPAASVLQMDFEHLNWSVPGGVEVQFGVAELNRSGREGAQPADWSAYMVRTATPHQVKIFDVHGKLLGLHPAPMDPALGFAIQVWGHLPARIEIRPRGGSWEVTLHSDAAFEAANVERASLHFGPNNAEPVAVHPKGADLVMSFRSADSGIRPGELNACLTGRRQDGVPFEGCDLLKRAAVR